MRDLVIQLLADGRRRVSYAEIVKLALEITGDSIPEALARTFADGVECITQNRLAIKEAVEAIGDHQLVIVDAAGHSVLRVGRATPSGFALRGTEEGMTTDKARIDMALGNVRKVLEARQPEALPALDNFRERLLPFVAS